MSTLNVQKPLDWQGYMLPQQSWFEKVTLLQQILVARATGGGSDSDAEIYQQLRSEFLTIPSIKNSLPKFVLTCRDLGQFWNFIQPEFPKYQQRRAFLFESFQELLASLERLETSPIDDKASLVLQSFDADSVNSAWQKALERRSTDPDGAITIARTLLETVCKHILDELGISYDSKDDLPALYRAVSQNLNLAPSQHTEEIFKQILGGCKSVVEGLGAVRNRLGDAHGTGKSAPRPKERHAELAVNLAGSMATFLVRTYQENFEQKSN